MAKVSGGTRVLKRGSREYNKRKEEVYQMQKSGKYSSVKMTDRGGYVAIEKSRAKHKAEEIEAAEILANKGYKVILKDEAGDVRTPDGYLFKVSFEQRTPQGDGFKNVNNCLKHARDKRVEISVIYDKYHKYHRKDIEKGLQYYESISGYRFKEIIVIAQDGKIYKHEHNNQKRRS
ncbi:MAG: hypothetical protein IJ213_03975 [Bacteroidales bacterium]|nr:hypothetical protein [Bacteroidales bacterium]